MGLVRLFELFGPMSGSVKMLRCLRFLKIGNITLPKLHILIG